jgi:tetratricopeptide (TPR) repeat protein
MMMLRTRLLPNTGQLAKDYARKGDFKRAIDAYAKGGEWQKAAQLCAEVKDEEGLVRCSLMAGAGRIPEGYEGSGAGPAAELLASRKRYDLAIPLFESAWELHRAAECALALSDPLRAARFYERSGDRLEAARCYKRAGKLREALHLLEEGSKTTPGSLSVAPGRQEEMTVLRLDLLRQLGRDGAAAALLSSIPPSPRVAVLLEEAGRVEEAIQCYLVLGDSAAAARVAAKCPDRDRQMARIHLKSGRAVEAGHLFAQLGLSREAAEAYEAGLDWARAAYRWEAAGNPARAAEAYERAGRLRDAERCFVAAGLPLRAAELADRKLVRAAAPSPSPARQSKALKTAAQLLAAGDKSRAASVLLQLKPDDHDFAKGVLVLAPLLLEEGFHDEALGRLGLIPLSSDRLYWEGRTREAMGDADGARRGYEQALALDSGHADARSRLRLLDEPPAPMTTTDAFFTELTAAPPSGTTSVQLFPGHRLAARYDILSQLGRGGMGRVYKAHDLELGETVAIKTLLRPSEGGQEESRLLREVQICRRISHPNVVRVYDLGRFPGGLFVTMEYLEGRSLDRVIAQDSPIPFDRVRAILAEVAEGLGEAHALGVVHRDLKPANIMVTAGRVKILDFGIARVIAEGHDPRMTQAGFVLGSPSYMSPDQLQGMDLDGRSDLYSLGILAYTLIAGREPFESPDPTVLALKQLRDAPPDIRGFRTETPDAWIVFLDKLVAKDREDRFQSAAEILDALRALPEVELATQLAPAPLLH